jgi:cbb3-type cytochrome oxidase subunit 3
MNLSMQVHAWGSFTRPIVLVVITLIILTIILAVRKQKKKKAEQAERLSAQDAADAAAPTIPMVVEEGGKNCPPASWPISALLVALFVYCFVDAMQWSFGSRIFPQTVATAGFLLALGALFFDLKGRAALKAGTAASDVVGVDKPYVLKSLYYLSWLIGIFVLTLVIGQFPALVLFVILYLKFWGNFGWKVILYYTIGAIAFLLIMFNEIVPVMWYEPAHLPSFFV